MPHQPTNIKKTKRRFVQFAQRRTNAVRVVPTLISLGLVCLGMLMSGCRTVPLTDAGKQVKVISFAILAAPKLGAAPTQSELPEDCKEMGEFSARNLATTGSREGAVVHLRNKVGKLGANFLVVTRVEKTCGGSDGKDCRFEAFGQAMTCNKK